MRRLIYITLMLASGLILLAQEDNYPRRTAADIANKQTEMLVRELGIHDSVMRDTLFRMYLKYAKMSMISNTRNEAIQRLLQMQEELKLILTPEQYAAFMNCQMDNHPRIPHHPCHWRGIQHGEMPPPGEMPPAGAPHNMPPPPPEHLPADHQ